MNGENGRFYRCTHCGNFVFMIHNAGVPLVCCGQPMEALAPNADGAGEKHTPVVSVRDGEATVSISDVAHPMLSEHWIGWIYLETSRGGQYRVLDPGDPPQATFRLAEDEQVRAAYSFCNLHGLWKS